MPGPSLLLLELQRRRVDAVADPRGVRPVGEEMAEVAAAVRAHHLGADHAEAHVRLLVDRLAARRRVERGPAAAGVVLRLRLEQRRAAACADVRPVVEHVVVLARERPLGALLAENAVLLRRQLFAPLRFGLLDWTHGPDGTNEGWSRTAFRLRLRLRASA